MSNTATWASVWVVVGALVTSACTDGSGPAPSARRGDGGTARADGNGGPSSDAATSDGHEPGIDSGAPPGPIRREPCVAGASSMGGLAVSAADLSPASAGPGATVTMNATVCASVAGSAALRLGLVASTGTAPVFERSYPEQALEPGEALVYAWPFTLPPGARPDRYELVIDVLESDGTSLASFDTGQVLTVEAGAEPVVPPDEHPEVSGTAYFADAERGHDDNSGTSPDDAWRTASRVDRLALDPGDGVFFRRGQSFTGPIEIVSTGTGAAPIVFGAYGTGDLPTILDRGMRIDRLGDAYITIRDLRFKDIIKRDGISVLQVQVATCSSASMATTRTATATRR